MSQSIMFRLLTGVVLAGATAVAVSAADTDEGTLGVVIVTAQKRAENAQEVPISMEVLGAAELESFNVNTVQDLQNYVPNLLVQQATVPAQYYIRGFGSQAGNDAFEQSVSVYVDGVYGGRNRQFMTPFFDVDQVEVLRGPQGALLGKNTAAGAVNITTSKPTDVFGAGATLGYNFNRNGDDIDSFVTGPLSQTINARLAVHAEDMPGWVHNTGTGTNDPTNSSRQIRPSVEFKPVDGVDLVAKFDYSQIYYTGNNLVRTSTTTNTITTTKNEPAPFGIPELDRTTSSNASINGRFAVGADTIETITGYSGYDNRYNLGATAGAPEVFVVGFSSDFKQYSQEVRLLSPTDQTFDYILGAYYDNSTFHTQDASTYNFGYGFAGQVRTVFAQNANTWSAFGQSTWHILENLRATGSVRFTHVQKSALFSEITEFGVPIATAPNLAGSEAENHTDPSLKIQYDVAPDVMVYATYGQGSKGGGFVSNTRTVVAADFQFAPEKSKSYEVGVKSTLFDRRLLLNLDVYDTKFDDLQVTTFNSTLLTYVTANAAKATSKGVEWSAEWLLPLDLKLSSSGAYLDGKYDDFPGAQCLISTPAAKCSASGTTNLGGTTLLGASKWTGNVGLQFNHPLTDNWTLSASGIAIYRSAYTISGDESPIYGVQAGVVKYDGNIEFSNGTWTAALIGKNIANKVTKSFAYNFSGIGVADVDQTRSILVQGRVRF